MKWCSLITILSLAYGWAAVAAAADSNRIRILAGGEDYHGPPIMTVSADGKVIGSVSIDNAITAVPVNQLTEKLMSASLKAYDFTVPSLKDILVLTIEFSNDKWSGSRATGDRNLWIGSVIAGDKRVASDQFAFPKDGIGRYGSVTRLADNGRINITRPKAGWSAAEVISASPSCGGKTTIKLSEYDPEQTAPSIADSSRLRVLLAEISDLSQCRIAISASTSPSGSKSVNAYVAKLRAGAVVALALTAGANPSRIFIIEPKSGERSVTIDVAP